VQSALIVDESFGLAVAAGAQAPRALVMSGLLFYCSWLAGTVLGIFGAQIGAIAQLAGAVFPVLFIGLAAVTARTRDAALRAAVAAAAVVVLALAVPELYAFLPIIAAVVVAIPGGRSA
jgi:predicted branched-subunit amino acid permease